MNDSIKVTNDLSFKLKVMKSEEKEFLNTKSSPNFLFGCQLVTPETSLKLLKNSHRGNSIIKIIFSSIGRKPHKI